jgi:hypothetical protein
VRADEPGAAAEVVPEGGEPEADVAESEPGAGAGQPPAWPAPAPADATLAGAGPPASLEPLAPGPAGQAGGDIDPPALAAATAHEPGCEPLEPEDGGDEAHE